MKELEKGRTRFQRDPLDRDVQLAKLREEAPGLGSTKRLRVYALLGSVLTLLTVAGFYYAVNIYKAISEERQPMETIEVDIAGEILISEPRKVLEELEAIEAAAAQHFEEDMKALKAVDLLEELEGDDSESLKKIQPNGS